MYFRNVLCRLKTQLHSEDHNAKAFGHFSAEAQARQSERTLLEDADDVPLRSHLGLLFGTPSTPRNANNQNQSSRTFVIPHSRVFRPNI